ncbi:MAG: hypothetical protein HY329_22135 [Chloroflexi bacterium]|nr:hypothetical protein [Chloroflexota bacterium]
MATSELCFLSATELAPLLQKREVSPIDVVEAHLSRIGELNEHLRHYITIDAEGARQAARVAESEIASGAYRGPLHGVAVAYKDIYDVRGLRTTAHSHVLDGYVAPADGTAAARLRAAGAICLGKLNTTEFASGNMPIYGEARNPWNTERTTGGSSSGSGGSLSARLVTLAMGSDTGGSVRQPAAFCGIVGLKPTYGRVSKAGIFPLSWSLDHAGPMGRTVADVALMLGVIAGADPADPSSAKVPVPDYRDALTGDVRGLRIGVPTSFYFDEAQTDPDVIRAVRAAIETLRGLGASVTDVDLPHSHLGPPASWTIAYTEAFAYHRRNFFERPRDYGAQFLRKITSAACLTGEDAVTAHRVRTVITREFAEALSRVDAIVTPTLAYGAHRIGTKPKQTDMRSLTRPVSLTGLPGLAVPCGFTGEGLPVSMQIVTRAFDEATGFRLAHAYEQATAWHRRLPPLSSTDSETAGDSEIAGQRDSGTEGSASSARSADEGWVLELARLIGLTYVTDADAKDVAAALRPVQAGLMEARRVLGDTEELATRPAIF